MSSRKITILLSVVFFTLLLITITASYYKYVVQRDYDSIFYIPCEEGEVGCFINTYDCTEGIDLAECAFVYKAVVVNQSILDNLCTPDEGECLMQTCEENPEKCQSIYCEDPKAKHYQLSDECAKQTPLSNIQSDKI